MATVPLPPEATMRQAPWRGWIPLLVLPAAVLVLTPAAWPLWAFMWLLALAIYAGCKWLTWRRTPAPHAGWLRHAGYLLAWPGLDAKAFLRSPMDPERLRPPASEWLAAAFKVALGVALFWGAGRLVPTDDELLMGWLGMTGLVLALHFGAFHLLSCAWRAAGVDAQPLMDRPLATRGVGEFWGKRWNTAFRDLTHRFLFRPLASRVGPAGALLVGFVFSGLVHDLVISVPAGGGYGRPTLYFALQIPALLLERSRPGRRLGLGRGVRGRLFALAVLAGPAFLLFHPPFVRNVVVPFMRAAGAA
jgi:hypothetical protein